MANGLSGVAGRPPAGARPVWAWSAAAALSAFVLDQATKAWALAALWPPYGEGLHILPVLSLRLGFNTGITFGMFAGGGPSSAWILAGLGLLVCAWLLAWMRRTRSGIEAAALGLVIGGATGNVLDRVRQGAVTDFVDAHLGSWHWPTFNLADAAIVCGIGILLAAMLRSADADAGQRGPGARQVQQAPADPR